VFSFEAEAGFSGASVGDSIGSAYDEKLAAAFMVG
jgi:hypothetical protein